MLRWLTAGESHGPSLVAILEGLPAHVRVTTDDLADSLARRRLGYGRGARMKFEQDQVRVLVGMQKYDFDEARPILERASARETAARVALGRVASNFLEQAVGARIVSHVIELGGVRGPAGLWPEPDDVARLDDDEVRCLDPDTSKLMVERIDQAHKDGDTLGGVVEVVVHGLPPGLGSHVHWDRRLDSRLAG